MSWEFLNLYAEDLEAGYTKVILYHDFVCVVIFHKQNIVRPALVMPPHPPMQPKIKLYTEMKLRYMLYTS